MKSISLVLGSGGARGLAHIGVIRWLEENGYRIVSISGSSMGALVGGIYAAGKLDEYERWVRAIDKLDIMTLLDLSWNKSGLVKGDKIIETLIDLVGEQHIEELPIRFTAVATDLQQEKEVWINSGRLFDAIRASISMPMFFTPYRYNGRPLIDGGVLNPVPIAPTFGDESDLTIAVNLGGRPKPQDGEKPKRSDSKSDRDFREKIGNYIEKLRSSLLPGNGVDPGFYDIANQSLDAMQSTIARQKLAAYPPDFTIEIHRNACGTLDFDRADEMITLGYRRAGEVLG